MVPWNIWFQSLLWFSFFEVCSYLMCTKSFPPPIRLKGQGNKEISSLTSYSWNIACMCIHSFEVLFYESWTLDSIWSPLPQRFCQSLLDFDLLSDVHFCMDISPITAHNAYLGAKVDFCMLYCCFVLLFSTNWLTLITVLTPISTGLSEKRAMRNSLV